LTTAMTHSSQLERDARSSSGATTRRVGGGDERIGAVIDMSSMVAWPPSNSTNLARRRGSAWLSTRDSCPATIRAQAFHVREQVGDDLIGTDKQIVIDLHRQVI
jgi:hypothetical protein